MSTAKLGLLSSLVLGLLAGQASATVITLDRATAAQFRQVALSPGDSGVLSLVIDRDGTKYYESLVYPLGVYEDTMQGQVGFAGILSDKDKSGLASMKIGGPITPGAYDGFAAYIANDNQSVWEYRLYASDGTTTVTGGVWKALVPGTSALLQLAFPAMTVKEIGFEIQANLALPNAPSNADVFYTSVVPVPGAFALTLFGLGFGLRLRKYVR